MNASVAIRPALAADLDQITAIYAFHVLHGTATFELDAPDRDEMRRRYEELTAQGYPYFVAEVGGRVVGFAYVGPFRTRPAYRFTVEDSIYIDSAYHRQGIGDALLRALIAASEARGSRQLVAVIGDSANVPSIALHRRCGFTDAGVLRASGIKFGRWVDTLLMQRSLGPGDTTLP